MSPKSFPTALSLLALGLAEPLIAQSVTRDGLLREWLPSSGLSNQGTAPYELVGGDTWADSVTGANLTVNDRNANDSFQVEATTIGGLLAISHTGTSSNIELEGAAFRTTNAAGLAFSWDFWMMLGDLSGDAVFFETGGGTHGASITIGDADLVGDDDPAETDRRDDMRVVLGGTGTSARLVLDMDLPDTVTSRFHHFAVVYDGQDLIIYLDGMEATRHATGSDQNQWQGTDPMGLLGMGGSAIGGDGSAGTRPFKDSRQGAKACAAFRWYDRGLTPDEVYGNYRAELNLVLADNRLHHWKLDEAAGATEAADSADTPIPLAITGASPEAEGIAGSAYTFVHPGNLLIHTPAENIPITRYSLSIWAKAASLGQANNSSIFNNGAAGQDFQIGINTDVYQFMGDSGTLVIGPVTTEWIHIALAQRGGHMQLYYDGKLVQTATRNDTLYSRFQVGVNRAQNQSFSGLIDDVAMIGEPFVPGEVAVIHGLGRFSGLALDDAKINEALALGPGGKVEGVGADNHIWLHASGLTGEQGSISGSIAGRDAIIVVGDDGTGLRYDGVPGEVPAIVLYSENPAVYGKDIAITPNVPTAQGSPTSYALTGTLPDGLTFDTATGVISGTPTPIAAETTYQITATNASGDSAAFDLVLSVTDQTEPVITLTGDPKVFVEKGTTYNDEGATAADVVDASVQVDTGGTVDTAVPGSYTLTYTATDEAGNEAAPVTREVVVEDLDPIVSTQGALSVSINQPDPYENDPGAEVDSFPHAPIAYYSMGGHARDTSHWGNNHHATLHGDASFATETHDSKGQSVLLDGTGDYLSVPGWKVIGGANPRTVSMWIKTNFAVDDTDYDAGLVSWGNAAVAGQKLAFRIQSNDGVNGAIRFEVNGGAIIGSTVVADGQWHHVAVVVPVGATMVSEVKLYVDGAEETASATIDHAVNPGNVEDFRIGLDSNGYHFPGHIDDVAIFDLALSAAEITAYHAASAPAITDDVASIDTNVPGVQTITYTSTDTSNRTSTSTRTVNVHDITFPTLSLTPGTETVTLTVDEVWNPYTDVTASDNTDGTLQAASALDLHPSLLRLHLSSRELAGSLHHGEAIAQWDDLSPHGYHVSQADATLQPLLNTGRTLTGGTLVADYAAEFSGTQGKDGWHYGYFEGALPYDPAQFTAMVGGSGNGAFTPGSQEWTGDADDTNGAWDRAAAVAPWTHISNTSIHPQGIDAPANIDTPQHPVIRWVSDVDGSIALSGYFNNTSGGGDGTTGRIFHNGTEAYFAFTDGYRKDFVVTLDVATGDNIDFLVDSGPADDSGTDSTTFAVTIHQNPTFSEAPYPFVTFYSPDYLTRPDTLGLMGSPEVTALFVAKRRNTARVLHLGAQSGEAGKVMGFVGDSSIRYSNGNAIFANNRIDDNTWHIASYLTDTAKGYSDTDLYVDGVMATQTSSATSTFPLQLDAADVETLVGLGRSSAGTLTDLFQGDIAEMIVLETRADAALLNAAHYFLTQKFGLPTGATKDNVATTYDTSSTSTQTITYYVSDAAGNTSSVSRTVIVQGNNKPTIAVTGDNPIQTILGQAYTDPGATAADVEDGDISGSIQADVSAVDTDQVGSYTVTYSVTDSGGKQATATRTVQVIDRTSPVIQLVGEDTLTIGQGSTYTDPGVTITDNVDSPQDLNAALGHVPMDGLVLHLDATKITGLQDGDPVSLWEDLTLLENDAFQDLQVDSRPVYVASTADKSMPAVRFDGTDDFLKIDSILAGGTIGRTIFAVFRPDDAGNNYFFSLNSLSVQNAGGSSYNYILTPEIGLRVANNKMFVNDVLSTTEASIFGIGNAQDALISEARAWKNGAELESTSVSGNSLLDIPGDLSTVGGRSATTGNSPGDAYEILVYNRLLDDDEIRVLQFHLQNKYSIAGTAGLVDTSTLGNQTVHYTVRDAAGNYATVTRAVNVVVDTWSPVITLNDSANLEVVLNSAFTDPGAVVTDDVDTGLQTTAVITDSNDQVVQTVDTSVDGATFTITYSATDSDGHTTSITRALTIIDADIVAPVITMNGRSLLIHPAGQDFTDPGATVLDNVDGVMTVTVNSDVDQDTPGTYTITYTAIDAAGNVATPVARTVRVQDLSPVIVLQGETTQSLGQNVAWAELGYRSIVLPATPIVYLSFDQNLRDHATLDGAQDGTGNTAWSTDIPMSSGHSLQFDGTNRITLTGYKGILGSNARAVSVWLKADPAINNSSKEITHWGRSADLERFTMRVNNTANHNEFRTDVDNGSTYGTTNIIDNAWHHLVVSYPAGGTLTDAKLYVDGILQSTTAGGLGATSPLNTGSNDDLRIGNTFNGLLDEFLLFDHDLTAAQVAALHQPETPAVSASTDTVDTADVASIDITYTATHTYGDSTATRTVNILDTTPPVITLTGTHPQPWETGTPYVEPGASATDNVDGSVTVTHSLDFPTSGLIGHWMLDEEVGNEAVDSSPNLQNGTIPATGVILGQSGVKETAYSFDGTAGVSMGDVAAMDSAGTFTFSTWFNRRSEIASETNHAVKAVLVAQSSAATNDNFEIGTSGTTVQIYMDTAGHDATINIEAGIQDNTWHHLVFTYDTNDAEGKPARLYIDNQLIDARSDWSGTLDNSGTSPLSIGLARPASDKWGMLDGLMDETVLWDFALSPAQIQLLHLHNILDVSTAGTKYNLTYTATDTAGNTSTAIREVIITDDLVPPTLSLTGGSVTITQGDTYTDPGYTANDAVDGNLTPMVIISGAVDTSTPGDYTLTYEVLDLSGNRAPPLTRTVTVQAASSHYITWLTETGLNALSATDQEANSDPDKDRLPNLLEYALGSDPTVRDARLVRPQVSVSGNQATLQFLRLKSSVDNSISFTVETTESLKSGTWVDPSPTISPVADQSSVTDPNYELVEVTLPAPTGKRQFVRITVSR